MKKSVVIFFCVFLALSSRAGAAVDQVVTGKLFVRGHSLFGTGPMLTNVSVDIHDTNGTGPYQISLFSESPCNTLTDTTCDELRIQLNAKAGARHIPIGVAAHILSPVLGAGAGFRRIRQLEIDDCSSADSSCHSLLTHAGLAEFGDSVKADKIMIYGAGIQYHGNNIATSRKLSDTDYVLIGDNSGGAIRDTLPTLATSIGREYRFFQKSTGGAFRWVIYPAAGEKINGWDSLVIQSNLGLGRARIFNISTRWEVAEWHNEGLWTASLTGTSAKSDTAWYTQDMLNFYVRIKPLVSTSNATTFGITGMGTQFTRTGLDTTYTAPCTAAAYNNSLKVEAHCEMPLSGADISCENVSSGFAAWTNLGQKGGRYGWTFVYRLPAPPSF